MITTAIVTVAALFAAYKIGMNRLERKSRMIDLDASAAKARTEREHAELILTILRNGR